MNQIEMLLMLIYKFDYINIASSIVTSHTKINEVNMAIDFNLTRL